MEENKNNPVELVSVEELEEHIEGIPLYSEEYYSAVRSWLKETGTTLYSRPKESFFKSEGYAVAREEGNSRLILENLS